MHQALKTQFVMVVATIVTTIILISLPSCKNETQQQKQKVHAMFDWINTMTTCPMLSSALYPKLDPKLQALYDKSLSLSRADGIVDQVAVTALYKEAAEKGHWPSMHNLAVRYYQGNGIEESDEKALYWYRQIEALDIPDGYTNMALVYRKGIGVPKDPDKALEYMSKAAQLGDPDAQFMLGKYLYHPLKRKAEAYKLLACAVKQNHRDAALELAAHYEVDEDSEKSYYFYRKGAMLGSDSCLNALSDAYAHTPKYPTFGLNKDLDRAICLENLVDELENNPELTFPDLDTRCPANVPQPPGRD